MRAPYALVASVLSLACAPVSAQATPTRACGKVGGYIVRSDQRTTTCGLARNAARNFLAGFGALGHAPRYIHGHSPKTGLTYRLRRAPDREHVHLRWSHRASAALCLAQIPDVLGPARTTRTQNRAPLGRTRTS